MILAQVDASALGGVSDFISKNGFSAALVLILLYGIWKLTERADKKQETREAQDIEREKARREEREADRMAHVSALGQNTAALGNLGGVVTRIEQKVDGLTTKVEAEALRFIKGGG